jgi:pimeloyl-ACP methyl ester carboxylesterase
MTMMPEPKHIEALHYPRDVSPTYSQLLAVVQSFVPASEPYVLLAESFSTPLAIQFAATHPENLKGLILVAGFAKSPVDGLRRSLASLLAPMIFHLPVPQVAIDHLLIGPNAPESLQQSMRVVISQIRPSVMAARLRSVVECDVRTDLSKVVVPILYIRATRDRLVPRSCMEEIQRILPQTKVVELDEPHLILQREPRQAAQAVSRFIQDTCKA